VKKDPEAFGRIYDTYASKVYRFVFFKVSSEEEAQDITADVFLKAWQYLLDEKGREVRHLASLLYGIARNNVIDFYRSRSNKETLQIGEALSDEVADERHLEQKTEAKIDVEFLGRQLRNLKDEYREVLVMRYLDELSIGEIAEALGKTAGNVRVLVHRAAEALKKHANNVETDHEPIEESQA
jgi:RNA polymerase sigma-70 factor (ECF subfamily)